MIITAIFDPAGLLIGFSQITRDLTETKQIEERLRTLDTELQAATRGKSTFLAEMSAKIRTPVQDILDATGLLADTSLAADQSMLLNTVQASAQALLTITKEFLDLSKTESGSITHECTGSPEQHAAAQAFASQTTPPPALPPCVRPPR